MVESGGEKGPDYRIFGDQLKEWIRNKGITQTQLAVELGTSGARVSNFVRGKQLPRRGEVQRVDELVGADGDLVRQYDALVDKPGEGVPDAAEARGALRDFLQRAEVRLSTFTRSACYLLGGAGLVVLLPVLLNSVLPGVVGGVVAVWSVQGDAAVLLGAGIAVALVLPFWGFLLILEDLTAFFFTGHSFGAEHAVPHHEDDEPSVVFNPRFALTGLRVPEGELTPRMYDVVAGLHTEHGRVVIPDDDRWRRRFDERVHRVFDTPPARRIPAGAAGDDQRLGYVFRLSASLPRTLESEAAKMELSLAKHNLTVRVTVLRYLKAVLLTVSAGVAALVAGGAVAVVEELALPPEVLVHVLAAVFLVWAPVAVGAVTAPLRWVHRASPGGGHLAEAYRDSRLVRFESAVVFLCLLSSASILAAVFAAAMRADDLPLFLVFFGGSACAWAFALTRWWPGRLARTPAAFATLLKDGASRQ
ncbi:helix-turn-helix domain-containing protein [Umezawaea tangerina]|uniref:helix-turn-helix domain-containing protein n=1 Tax=Umezawaea tangerina TaxID=84725 RepID=UPI000A7318CE|nr:helix-turn-helix transcriptional regulator [Umezawaea tangerina]